MATDLEYALLSEYVHKGVRRDVNKLPLPNGWTQLEFISDKLTGYEAGAYTNGSEIVIAYAGTGRLERGLVANSSLGLGSTQLLQAAEYYLQVRDERSGIDKNPQLAGSLKLTG